MIVGNVFERKGYFGGKWRWAVKNVFLYFKNFLQFFDELFKSQKKKEASRSIGCANTKKPLPFREDVL